MPNFTVIFGSALILTGAIVYFATGQESLTAMLPSVAGIPVAIAGMVAMNPQRRRVALTVAAGLVGLMALGTLRGVFKFLAGDVTTASTVNTLLFVVSMGYLAVYALLSRSRSRAQNVP